MHFGWKISPFSGCCCSVTKSSLTLATPWTAAHQAPLSFTISRSLLKFISIESVMLSNHLTLCCPLLLLPSIFPSIRVFSNESTLHIGWSKYWSFGFSISPSNKYWELISFRMDRLDLLAVQGTLYSLFQHHNSKASILQQSAFLMVQLSHPYMTTGKTRALTIWTFVGKVMSLLLMSLRIHLACVVLQRTIAYFFFIFLGGALPCPTPALPSVSLLSSTRTCPELWQTWGRS